MKGNPFTITMLCLLSLRGSASDAVRFTDVTAAAGIKFTHNAGRSGKKWLPETMGPGCAFFDADGDGNEDLLVTRGGNSLPAGMPDYQPALFNLAAGNFYRSTEQVARTRGIVLNITPETHDEIVDGARIRVLMQAPHFIEHALA